MKILSLSGFIPECFCDTVRFTGYAGDRNISHYCGYASDFISHVLCENSIDGAVFPKSCDSTRIIKSYLEDSGKFIYQMPVPTRSDEFALEYLASVLRDFEEKLCRWFGLDKIDIQKRIGAINQRNKKIREIYHNIEKKSFYSLLCATHDMLSRPLFEQDIAEMAIENRKPTDKRVYIIGSFLSNTNIAKIIEENGLTVVGDDLPELGRLASGAVISTEGDYYKNIAENILTMRKSPTQDQFDEICNTDMREIKEKEVTGVVFITQKYCEAYDYLFYHIKNSLDKMGISSVQISLSDSQDEGKARLHLEAFADIL